MTLDAIVSFKCWGRLSYWNHAMTNVKYYRSLMSHSWYVWHTYSQHSLYTGLVTWIRHLLSYLCNEILIYCLPHNTCKWLSDHGLGERANVAIFYHSDLFPPTIGVYSPHHCDQEMVIWLANAPHVYTRLEFPTVSLIPMNWRHLLNHILLLI